MKIFRVQEHTPDVYPRKSRDFQLLCNIFDCLNNAVKYDIDSIRDTIDTNYCNDKLLNYLQTKLGFFSSIKMDARAQRIILKGFSYILKYKGSRKGIVDAIYLFLKSQGIYGEVFVNTRNTEIITDSNNETFKLATTYVVEVATNVPIENIKLLDEILKYIIPAGYLVKYSFYETYPYDEIIEHQDKIRIIFAHHYLNRQLRSSELDEDERNLMNVPTEDSELERTLYPYGHTFIGAVSTAKVAPMELKEKGLSFEQKEVWTRPESQVAEGPITPTYAGNIINYKPINLFDIDKEEGDPNA